MLASFKKMNYLFWSASNSFIIISCSVTCFSYMSTLHREANRRDLQVSLCAPLNTEGYMRKETTQNMSPSTVTKSFNAESTIVCTIVCTWLMISH